MGQFGNTRFDPRIQKAFEALASRPGYGPTKIARELERHFAGEAPKLRTIKDWLARYKPPETGDVWNIDQMSPEDASVVLGVQLNLLRRSGGNIGHFSSHVADWIAFLNRTCPTIREAAPDDDYLGSQDRDTMLYTLADTYARRRAIGEPTLDLDGYLVFRPWESKEQRREYRYAVEWKWVPEPPSDLMTRTWYWFFDFLATVTREDHEREYGRE